MVVFSRIRRFFFAGTISLIVILVYSFTHNLSLSEKLTSLSLFYQYFFEYTKYSPPLYVVFVFITSLAVHMNPISNFFMYVFIDIGAPFRDLGNVIDVLFNKDSDLDKGWTIFICIWMIILVAVNVIGVLGICR